MKILTDKILAGFLYFCCVLLSVFLYFQGFIYLSFYLFAFVHFCLLLFYSEKIYMREKVRYTIFSNLIVEKYSVRKYFRFFGISGFVLFLSLILEYVFFHFFIQYVDKLVLISLIYIISAIVLSILLSRIISLDVSLMEFQFLAGICILTLLIHLALIVVFPEIPILFFRAFGFILDVFLLLLFLSFFYFQIYANNKFLQVSDNLPFK